MFLIGKMRLFVFLLLSFLSLQFAAANLKRVCYLESWARYRHDPDKFSPEDYGSHLCTHLIWSFVTLDDSCTHLKPFDPADEPDMYRRLIALKNTNPDLKILLSVGGWDMGSTKFHQLVSSTHKMTTFANNVVDYLHKYGFDGLDIDWEFPTSRGSPPEDKGRFTVLLRKLHHAFHEDGAASGRHRLLLTAAEAGIPRYINSYYECSNIAHYLDFINVMTYDFHGNWNSQTAHHSPLYGPSDDPLTVEKSLKAWADEGVPKTKLLLGLPLYGHYFTLKDVNQHGLGADIIHSDKEQTRAYYEVCRMLQQGAEKHWLSVQHEPYLVQGNGWIGYDDEKSIAEKVQFAVNQGYGGVFVWALDLDDVSGVCGKPFPLMHTIKDTMSSHVIG